MKILNFRAVPQAGTSSRVEVKWLVWSRSASGEGPQARGQHLGAALLRDAAWLARGAVVVDDTAMIGARVRAVRVRQGMSLGALAAATGLSKAHLSRIERGERSLDRRSTLQAIADALRTPVAELTGQPFTPRNQAETTAHAAALGIRDVLMWPQAWVLAPPADLSRWRPDQPMARLDFTSAPP